MFVGSNAVTIGYTAESENLIPRKTSKGGIQFVWNCAAPSLFTFKTFKIWTTIFYFSSLNMLLLTNLKASKIISKDLCIFEFQQIIMSYEKNWVPKLDKQKESRFSSSLLDLPEWILDCILEYLSPLDLCRVAQVCTYLRHISRSDALWEKKIEQKWGRLLSDVAYKEWQWHTTKIINTESLLLQHNQSVSCGSSSGVWPLLDFHSILENFIDLITLLKSCSKMVLYICLETGRFWFPVQVHKNSNLFCYDAIVSYDSRSDTFQARSPTGGWRLIEVNVHWDRLRLSPVETSPREFYMSNYWWYAVIGHLETCDEDVNHCHCQYSETLIVEFKQYQSESRMRRSVLNRNKYEEQGSRLRWFGGIRKLDKEEEIEKWSKLLASR
ncbi:hypothetical protein Fmac_029621 [Flemingia macrophylla]|uniref:F-box domain-containing protein n=1 Tax=Flemingia macrophylla TaxID=520843 RepID=A0ABD1LAU3_9FABA